MSYLPQNKASFKNGKYDYSVVFEKVKPLLYKSDYVVGNLETPIAGEELIYTYEGTVFNTPIEFAEAIRDAGIKTVSLANNHCLDRGLAGLRKTILNLKQCGIESFGCYLSREESALPYILEVEGFRIALLGYTYGTNSEWRNNILSNEDDYSVDLFREQDKYIKHTNNVLLRALKKTIRAFTPHCVAIKIRNPIVVDGVKSANITEGDRRFVERMEAKIRLAKNKADLVIMCMHSGGQFNDEIGEYTEDLVKRLLNNGCDIVVGNHPHDILGHRKINNKLVTYSLGNFCYTPKYDDYINDVLSEYSLLLHLYIDVEGRSISKTTVSLLRTIKQNDGNSVVYPVHDLIMDTSFRNKSKVLMESKKALKRFGIDIGGGAKLFLRK